MLFNLRNRLIGFLLLTAGLTSPVAANSGFDRLEGHGGPIMGIAAATENDHVLSASFDYAVGYWNGGETAIWLVGHNAAVNAVSFLPGNRAVSAGDDYKAIVWDLDEGQAIHSLEGHTGKILGVTSSPDGSVIATASWDGRVGLWNVSNGELLRWIEGHRSSVNDVAFSSDGKKLYTASHDGTIRRWDAFTGEQKQVEVKHGFGINRVIINDEAGWLAYGALDGGTRVLDLKTGGELADVTLDRRPILSLAMKSDGSRLAVGDGDGYIMVLETENWTVVRDFRAVKAGPVWALAYGADGRLRSGGLDPEIVVWPDLDDREVDIAAQGSEQHNFHRSPGEMENGERQFVRKCSICHRLDLVVDRRAGPPLGGVFGRQAGTVEGYAYSGALLGNSLIWDENTINELFRIGPDALTPGSKMPMQQISGEQDRIDLVNYLREATAGSATAN